MAEVFFRKFPAVKPEAKEKERAKPLRSPVIIAVAVDNPSEPKVVEIENICAAAAACENILLAAHAMGLGGHWRTGDAARDPDVKNFLGFSVEQHLIAFLYIGYPEVDVPPAPRPGFQYGWNESIRLGDWRDHPGSTEPEGLQRATSRQERRRAARRVGPEKKPVKRIDEPAAVGGR
jgi:hypothetical protein